MKVLLSNGCVLFVKLYNCSVLHDIGLFRVYKLYTQFFNLVVCTDVPNVISGAQLSCYPIYLRFMKIFLPTWNEKWQSICLLLHL